MFSRSATGGWLSEVNRACQLTVILYINLFISTQYCKAVIVTQLLEGSTHGNGLHVVRLTLCATAVFSLSNATGFMIISLYVSFRRVIKLVSLSQLYWDNHVLILWVDLWGIVALWRQMPLTTLHFILFLLCGNEFALLVLYFRICVDDLAFLDTISLYSVIGSLLAFGKHLLILYHTVMVSVAVYLLLLWPLFGSCRRRIRYHQQVVNRWSKSLSLEYTLIF